jgi:hypothetical protein
VPQGTTVHGTNSDDLQLGYQLVVSKGGIGGPNEVTCTNVHFTGTARNTLKMGIGTPQLSDGSKPRSDVQRDCLACPATYGTDTLTANNTHGKWLLEERDYGNNGSGDEG